MNPDFLGFWFKGHNIMSTDCIYHSPDSLSLDMIKQKYPAYYRAWKSMLNYGKNEISLFWRGTHGLLVFIEDTVELDDSPSKLPEFADYIKLKRVDSRKKFAPDNVVWKIAKVALKNSTENAEVEFEEVDSLKKLSEKVESVIPQSLPSESKLFRRIEDKEARLEELFSKSLEGTINKSEELELEVLSKAVVESVQESSDTDIEEFYNKRWSDL